MYENLVKTIEKRQTRLFVSKLFETVRQHLHGDSLALAKGLGTWNTQPGAVSQRTSVNLDTYVVPQPKESVKMYANTHFPHLAKCRISCFL